MSDETKAFELYKQVMDELKIVRSDDLRDQFAMAALQGLLTVNREFVFEDMAKASYQLADAMLKEKENAV